MWGGENSIVHLSGKGMNWASVSEARYSKFIVTEGIKPDSSQEHCGEEKQRRHGRRMSSPGTTKGMWREGSLERNPGRSHVTQHLSSHGISSAGAAVYHGF